MDKFTILCESIKVNLDLLASTYTRTVQHALALQEENKKLKTELESFKIPVKVAEPQPVV